MSEENENGKMVAVAQASLTNDAWTRERVDLVKKTVCPAGIPDADFMLFIEQCKRSGLDPLLKEAFCVKRRQNIGTKERPNWIEKFEFQPAETGFLARAERFPDFKGVTAAAVWSGDEAEIDAGAGTVKHTFKPTAKRGVLLGAWGKVERKSKTPIVVWLDIMGYQQQTPLWGKMAPTMIEKCARVAVLRKAYPSALGGLYIDGEPSSDTDDDTPSGPVVDSTATTTTLAKTKEEAQERLTKALATVNGTVVDASSARKAIYDRIVAIGAEMGLDELATRAELKTRTGKTNAAQLTEEDVQAFAKWADNVRNDEPPLPDEPPPMTEEQAPF